MSDSFRSFFRPQPLPDTFFNRAYADLTGAPIESDGAGGDATSSAAPSTTRDVQLAMKAVRPRPTTPAQTPEERTRVIFGETAGLYPESKDPSKPPHDPNNWVEGSADDLATARRHVGIVAGRNSETYPATPNKPSEGPAWDAATAAGKAAHENPAELDPEIDRFFIRGKGIDKRPFSERDFYYRLGPFRNVGGGDAPAGNDTYIEFYGKKKSR